MKVLVTGATGFIGSRVVSVLSKHNFETYGLARKDLHKNNGGKFYETDITSDEQLNILEKEGSFDAIIHCAGLAHQFGNVEKVKFEEVNVRGTKNITELAVKLNVKHFILISTTAVYGFSEREVDETAPCRPDTEYAKSKLKAEEICNDICSRNQIALTIFRLAPVLGEKGIGNIPRLIKSIYDRRFVWVGSGKNKKSLIYVDDIALACMKLLTTKKHRTEIYNLAAKPIKMKKLVEIISIEIGRKVPGISIPKMLPEYFFKINRNTLKLKLIANISKIFEKFLSDDLYSSEKIQNEYGFMPETSIETAVKKQCRWFLRELEK